MGREHPHEDDYTEPMRDVIVFSIVSAVVGVVVNQLLMRPTAKWYGLDKIGGELAEDLKDSGVATPVAA